MAQQSLNNGETYGSVRTKVNSNFTEVYTNISDHLNDTVDAHDATAVSTTGLSQLGSPTTVQAALEAGISKYAVVVTHGTNATTARPSGATVVIWVGSVEPVNGQDGDIYVNTTV